MKTIFKQLSSTMLAGLLVYGSGCTKAKYDDDFTKGDPPPIAGGYTNSKQVASTNLVAYWAFNGSLVDSAKGLTGTNTGTTFATGQKGSGLQIGGTNYYLIDNPGTIIPNLSAYTISFWMKAPQNTSFGYGILSLNNPTDFWGSLDIYLDNGSSSTTGQFKVHMTTAPNPANPIGEFLGVVINDPWNKWVHLVVTYDNSTTITTPNFIIYQNGSPVYSTLLKNNNVNLGALKFPGPTKLVIGTWQFQTTPSLTSGATAQPWAGSFGGVLDELRIYDRPLTALEVSALFKLEKQGR